MNISTQALRESGYSTTTRYKAYLIVTYNLTDFPQAALASHGIEAQHPNEFVSHLHNLEGSSTQRGQPIITGLRSSMLGLDPQKSALGKTHAALSTYYQVVEDTYIEEQKRFLESLREQLIGTRRLGVTRGMVVNKD